MKRFMLITNNEKKKNIEAAEFIKKEINKRGGDVTRSVMPAPTDPSPMKVPNGTDAIITIGGDGTMVRSAQRTIGSNTPLIGVNRGHLGYLCDINEDNVKDSIELLIEDKYIIEERMMLSGELLSTSEGYKYPALNDIIIRGKNGQAVIDISIYVNGGFLYSYTGDGIILATPTGSTAYNLSAYGPIVEPTTEVILVTPINPHSINTRSIILDPKDEISVKVESRRSNKRDFAVVAFDGGQKQNLSHGDIVSVKKAKEKTRFLRLDYANFVERMKTRLGG